MGCHPPRISTCFLEGHGITDSLRALTRSGSLRNDGLTTMWVESRNALAPGVEPGIRVPVGRNQRQRSYGVQYHGCQSSMTEQELRVCPVWTWNDTNDGWIPATTHDGLANDDRLFIRATFFCPNGIELIGYVSGWVTLYMYAVFYDGVDYLFNANTPDLNSKSREKLAEAMGEPRELRVSVAIRNGFTFHASSDWHAVVLS
jgi:hypothetical protein